MRTISRTVLLILVLANTVSAGAPDPAPSASPPPPTSPASPPGPPPWTWDGEYRLRATYIDLDQDPSLTDQSRDYFLDHRLRLGLTVPLGRKLILRSRFTTQASRFGDFDNRAFMLATRRFDFDQLHAIYLASPETTLIVGRGNNRYFEVDLAAATGRFNEDDVQYDGIVIEHRPTPKLTLIGAYGNILATNRIDADNLDFGLDGVLAQARYQFTPSHRLLVHAGSLYPKERNFIFPGKERADLAVIRYDFTPSERLRFFVMASRTLRPIDAFTFLPLSPEAEGDQAAVFGGILIGNKENRGENQYELYFAQTGRGAAGITTEFPNNIQEFRGLIERQVGNKVYARASFVHRELAEEAPPQLLNDQDTAFVQLLARF